MMQFITNHFKAMKITVAKYRGKKNTKQHWCLNVMVLDFPGISNN